MSFDLNITTTCDHRVYWEQANIYKDLRSLRVTRPIGSTSKLQVYSSGNLVPKEKYSIVADPQTIFVNQPRMIYFKEKERSTNNFYEINYQTIKEYCPKCVGLNDINDVQYDVQGALLRVRDEALLIQNVEKFTITIIGSNIFHTFIGTGLVNLLGSRIMDLNYLRSKISQEINNTLNKLSDMQRQYEGTRRPVTDGEMLQSIDNIEVNQDTNDPSILWTDITITARSGKSVVFTQPLRKVA